jgi:hypothetical protein
MFSRLMITAMLFCGLAVPAARASHTWDLALNGGWMRVLIDYDLPTQSVYARIAPTQPGGSSADIAECVLIDRGSFFLLQGTITSGTFKVGISHREFTVGDHFFLFLSKYTSDVMLVLVDQMSVSDSFAIKLTYF